MNRDRFSFQVMGFTDPMAAQFKEGDINAFNEMKAKLRELAAGQKVQVPLVSR